MPSPSYNFFEASSRGDKGVSLEEEERGVVGEEFDPADLDELEEYPSSLSASDVSIATAGSGCCAARLKRKG